MVPLRACSAVIATSRFPRNTAMRYLQEPDCGEWTSRLHVYGIDLRIVPSIDALVDVIKARCAVDVADAVIHM